LIDSIQEDGEFFSIFSSGSSSKKNGMLLGEPISMLILKKLSDNHITSLGATADYLLELLPTNWILLEDKTHHIQIYILRLRSSIDDGLE